MNDTKEKKTHKWPRDPHDWYVEPEAATVQLLAAERFTGLTYDPACGKGNIVRTFIANGNKAIGSDLIERVPAGTKWFVGRSDFLQDDYIDGVDNVAMNPPFYKAAGAEAFIRKALTIATGKVAVFVDLKFLGSAKRAKGLFAEFPPNRIWILIPRPSCPPGTYIEAGHKAGGGYADWAWIIWDATYPKEGTRFGWLNGVAQ